MTTNQSEGTGCFIAALQLLGFAVLAFVLIGIVLILSLVEHVLSLLLALVLIIVLPIACLIWFVMSQVRKPR